MNILFVCTGNTCRSPMAEGMMRQMAGQRGVDVEVRSAGVAAGDGMPVSRYAQAVLNEQGINDQMKSTPLHAELVEWSDLILALTSAHKRQIVLTYPDAADKIYTLKEYAAQHNATNKAEREELQRLTAELELDLALGKKPDEAMQRRLAELIQRMPNVDISDPFGGTREDYNRTAAEIRTAIEQILDKLKQDGTD